MPHQVVSLLQEWFHQHKDWPYPNEEEQKKLAEEVGVSSKQINTWFINARKRRRLR